MSETYLCHPQTELCFVGSGKCSTEQWSETQIQCELQHKSNRKIPQKYFRGSLVYLTERGLVMESRASVSMATCSDFKVERAVNPDENKRGSTYKHLLRLFTHTGKFVWNSVHTTISFHDIKMQNNERSNNNWNIKTMSFCSEPYKYDRSTSNTMNETQWSHGEAKAKDTKYK